MGGSDLPAHLFQKQHNMDNHKRTEIIRKIQQRLEHEATGDLTEFVDKRFEGLKGIPQLWGSKTLNTNELITFFSRALEEHQIVSAHKQNRAEITMQGLIAAMQDVIAESLHDQYIEKYIESALDEIMTDLSETDFTDPNSRYKISNQYK